MRVYRVFECALAIARINGPENLRIFPKNTAVSGEQKRKEIEVISQKPFAYNR
jgi:hypothetical protein